MAAVEARDFPLPPLARDGILRHPEGAEGLVLFAHGSGSGKRSPRNNYVAQRLAEAGLASLLFDLLTPDEEQVRSNVFDVGLLAVRLAAASDWVSRECAETASLRMGYFGASTGAAAALAAAALPGSQVGAIVSRGGRPDLAMRALGAVTAPTLLIVGGDDDVVVDLNREAYDALRCEKRLAVVEGASHLFEEPGTLDEVVRLAQAWFLDHLSRPSPRSP